jgi:hypothetical protein
LWFPSRRVNACQKRDGPFAKNFCAHQSVTSTRSDCRELLPPRPRLTSRLLLQCCYTQRAFWCVLVRASGRCSNLTVTWRRCSIACIHGVTMQVYAWPRKPLEIIGLASTPSVGTTSEFPRQLCPECGSSKFRKPWAGK